MEEWHKQELLEGRIPKVCPFCGNEEFHVWFAEDGWVLGDAPTVIRGAYHDRKLTVICSKCEEEILEGDVRDG